ncbi:MAG TPA: FAD-dependent oxidoreductase [Candidatus Norongarragalinales archaeon]|nr:FAD-dependent oxidoreductase [Candidatus Norongarragalinales archaeon]
MNKKIFDVIIIGGGPAAVSAAIYAARAKLDVAMVYKDIGGQMALSGDIDNYPGIPGTNGPELTAKFQEHLERYPEIERFDGVSVTRCEKQGDAFLVTTSEHDLYSRSVIVATGAGPRKLGVPGEEKYYLKGVSYCAVCDGPLFNNKTIAVIGGGNSALDAAQFLAKIGKKIILINKNPAFKGDPTLFDHVKKLANVEIHYDALTLEILGDGGGFASGVRAKTAEGVKTFEASGIFIEIGRVPANDFLVGVERHPWGEVKTNKNTETNIPGLFAAGDNTDCATKQIVVAAGEGCVAAIKAFEFVTKTKAEGY